MAGFLCLSRVRHNSPGRSLSAGNHLICWPCEEAIIVLVALFLLPYVIETSVAAKVRPHNRVERTFATQAELPSISLIVPTYNEEKNIDTKLQNLFEQSYPKERMEIIVVDSSTDSTPRKVGAWMDRVPNIRLVTEPQRMGLAHALNLGYSAARGDIVIKSDCDILYDEDSVSNIVMNFADPKVGAVSGRQKLRSGNDVESGYRELLNKKRRLETRFGSAYIVDPFCAFRKSLVEKIYERSASDDAELAIKIRKKGFYSIFDENAVFYEQTPKSKLERLKQKQRRAQGHIQLHLQQRSILLKRDLGIFSSLIFPATFWTVVLNPWLLLTVIMLAFGEILSFGLSPVALTTLLGLCVGLVSYLLGKPKYLAGFFESQMALLVGWFVLILKGPSYMWTK